MVIYAAYSKSKCHLCIAATMERVECDASGLRLAFFMVRVRGREVVILAPMSRSVSCVLLKPWERKV